MKIPLVVYYLRNGKTLADLETDHGVVARKRGNKVSLSYHQINAHRGDPLASQCRGLILRDGTWDVVAYPFDRFFKRGEDQAADIDWATASVQEKMDGTMVIAYYDEGKWHVGTRKDPEADTPTPAGVTYHRMFESAVLSMTGVGMQSFLDGFAMGRGYTYVFELTAPENQVVCAYKNRQVWLLGMRNMQTMEEEDPGDIFRPKILSAIGQSKNLSSSEWLQEYVESRSAKHHEGLVVVDAYFNRIKIKSKEYERCSHALDADKTYSWEWRMHAPWRSLVEAVITDKVDHIEKLSSDKVREQIAHVRSELDSLCFEAEIVFHVIEPIDDMKLFAELAKKYRWPSVLFALKRGTAKTAMEHARQTLPKTLVRLCGLKGA